MIKSSFIRSLITLVFVAVSLAGYGQRSFTLDEAIAYAEQHKNDIKLQDIAIKTAEQDIQEVKSIGMPHVDGKVDYSYYYYTPLQPVEDFIGPAVYSILAAEGLPTTTQGPPQTFKIGFVQPNQLTAGISASMLVFDGSYLYGLRGAKLYRELARKQKDLTTQQLRANVTQAYLSILIAELNRNTLEDNINILNKSLVEVNALYKEGFVESLDVDRLQLSYDNLTTQLQNVEGYIDLSKNLLKFQMGMDLGEQIELSEDIDQLISRFDAEVLQADGSIDPSLRQEYQLIDLGQALNDLNLKRYKAGYYPSVVAFTSFQESLQRKNLFDGDESGFIPTGVVGLNVRIPIYDGGEKKAQMQKVRLDMEKTNIQKDEFVNAMSLQVRNAQVALLVARRNLENKVATLEKTKSIYERTQIKFREGVGSSVEVTQAEGALYQIQAEYNAALYELLKAKVDIDIALGKL